MRSEMNDWTTTKIICLILFVCIIGACLTSCQSQKQFVKKGFERGWIDTSKIKLIDTVKFYGSSKDTSFLYSSDTIVLQDKNFTTFFYRDTVTQKHYLKTIVNNHDTVIVREVQQTIVKATEYTFTDHLKAVWYIWLILFALMLIIGIWALSRK